jgi:hypothetical protein
MSKTILFLACLLAGLSPDAQEWEGVKADSSYIWGEGWGASVEEADQMALSALASRITVAVTSDFRQVEEQVRTGRGEEYRIVQSNRSSAFSSLTLPDTHRVVLKTGRRAHVGRWIRRDELAALFADRASRVTEYERSAVMAEGSGRVDDALRYHYWAYALLRSLPHPAAVRDWEGRMMLNTIPERLNGILEDLRVSAASHVGDAVRLRFYFRGTPVEGLDFSYFDGARWVKGHSVRNGTAVLEMAHGALAETIQLRIEYMYRDDLPMDRELSDAMRLPDLKPLRKAFITFRTR